MKKKLLFLGVNILVLTCIFLPTLAFAREGINQAPINETVFKNKFNNIVNIMAFVAVAMTVIFIIWGGFKWITGDAKEGRSYVKNGVVGLIIVLVAFLLVKVIVGAVEGVKSSGAIDAEQTTQEASVKGRQAQPL